MIKRKVFFSILVALILCILISAPVLADQRIFLAINGERVLTDVNPVIISGRTLVPIRVVSESLGYIVEWNMEYQIVKVINNDTELELKIGTKAAWLDGQPVYLDVTPIIVKDRVMVPLRFISEMMGHRVEWVKDSNMVMINAVTNYDSTEAESQIKKAVEDKSWYELSDHESLNEYFLGIYTSNLGQLFTDANYYVTQGTDDFFIDNVLDMKVLHSDSHYAIVEASMSSQYAGDYEGEYPVEYGKCTYFLINDLEGWRIYYIISSWYGEVDVPFSLD